MAKITSSIAGVFQYPNAKELMKAMPAGAYYHFEAEPLNVYDVNAIALFVYLNSGAQGLPNEPPIKCGYIPKVLAAQLKAANIESVEKGTEKFDQIIVTTKES